jgi:hypothetical protein
MGFVLRNFLHYMQVIDGREEVSKRVGRDRVFGDGSSRISQFIHFRANGSFYKFRTGELFGRGIPNCTTSIIRCPPPKNWRRDCFILTV